MKKMKNTNHIEGYIYEHDLQARVSGPNSKNPGTNFIMGTLSIATDEELTNIIPIHFSYVTPTTSSGATNQTYTILSQIVDGTIGTVMSNGADNAGKIRIDTSIALNDFYTKNRITGEEELASPKRNEGGFIHMVSVLNDLVEKRNEFEIDILITNFRVQEANEERNLPEKGIIKGAIFNFRNDLLPVEFSVLHPDAISYFESLGASTKEPVLTRLKGRQISETIIRKVEEESAFGPASVKEVPYSHKDWVITWAQPEPYLWDDESTITGTELKEAMAARETYLATVKQRQDAYNASKVAAAKPEVAKGGFDF